MSLWIVGIGPGKPEGMTAKALEALTKCEVIAGYTVYVELLRERFPDKEYYSTPMKQEIARCRQALEEALRGRETALVCSGDAGIYGMAGLVFELAQEMETAPDIRIIPGVTAASSAAALLGAPLGHDFAVISLSDLLTDRETIKRRLEAAAMSDMGICLYNPSSKKRADYLQKACDLILRYRSPETICGYARNIGRDGEEARVLTLKELRETQTDMFTTVCIGSSQTRQILGRMVTPRGYQRRPDGPRTVRAAKDHAVSGGRMPAARVVIFGGTTEGRLLYEKCRELGVPVTVFVATDYGGQLLTDRQRSAEAAIEGGYFRIHTGRLDTSEMEAAIRREGAALVFDATHPFAKEATDNIHRACACLGTACYRVRRALKANDAAAGAEALYFDSIEEAVAFLGGCEGNILAATGSQELKAYTALADFRERLYVRVLPLPETLAACIGMGITGRHLAAMQGPFSEEMNYGFLKEFKIRWMVTKQSGNVGGFAEKCRAAGRAGTRLLIIRKEEETGISLKEAMEMLEVLT